MFYGFVIPDLKLRMEVSLPPVVINDITDTAGNFVAGSVTFDMMQTSIHEAWWEVASDMLASAITLEDALKIHGGKQSQKLRMYVNDRELESKEEIL